ncbi:MAG: hypothetical protein A2612_01555 [Candidatus Moranbacteria bacterium RIFOXYD1_FULL_44_12]|nr:MAG: hypothetical protein A2612_01555 [Candidatus Moranbacteria bacterium RIFOXYD1_FULL_44_12]
MKTKEEVAKPVEIAQLTDKERALLILKGQIATWRHLEKVFLIDQAKIAKKVGAIRFVSGLIEKM